MCYDSETVITMELISTLIKAKPAYWQVFLKIFKNSNNLSFLWNIELILKTILKNILSLLFLNKFVMNKNCSASYAFPLKI